MPKDYLSLTQEQKQEIISRIKEKGERVSDTTLLPCEIPEIFTKGITSDKYMVHSARVNQRKKRLGGLIPYEVFYQKTGVALDS